MRPRWKTMQPRETYEIQHGGIHLEIFRTNHVPEKSESWEASFISYGMFVDGNVRYRTEEYWLGPLSIKLWLLKYSASHFVHPFLGEVRN